MGTPSICFLACIESGPLEAQTVRLAASLRVFGGALADSEFLAVTPRLGPPLAATTKRRLHDLGVRHERVPAHPGFAWYHYMNKVVALTAAERLSGADVLVFVDSDALVVAEPEAFVLPPDADAAACVPDDGIVGTTGPDSPHEPSWRYLCDTLEIPIDSLPWVTTPTGQRIRLYFNSGIFAVRRSNEFSRTYLELLTRALESRAGFGTNGEHFLDQTCLGLSMHRAGLRMTELPYSHNFTVLGSWLDDEERLAGLADARVLHYHDATTPTYWEKFLTRMEAAHPEVVAWLRSEGPVRDPAPAQWRVAREALRVARGLPRRRYRRQAQPAAL